MGQVGKTLANSGKAVLWYAEKLLAGVDDADFRRKPAGPDGEIDTNHPAFILGHLAIYPASILKMMDVDPGPAAVPESYEDLFNYKAECRADAEGSLYPGKEELVSAFFDSHRHLLGVIEETSDEVFARELPNESMRDFFPTIGDMADFMVGAHAMGHLGQLSAWRRCMGLGSAMKADGDD